MGKRVGVCARCHRPLTDPKSVAAGMGPVCREKFAAALAAMGDDGELDADAEASQVADELASAEADLDEAHAP